MNLVHSELKFSRRRFVVGRSRGRGATRTSVRSRDGEDAPVQRGETTPGRRTHPKADALLSRVGTCLISFTPSHPPRAYLLSSVRVWDRYVIGASIFRFINNFKTLEAGEHAKRPRQRFSFRVVACKRRRRRRGVFPPPRRTHPPSFFDPHPRRAKSCVALHFRQRALESAARQQQV